MLKYYNTQKLHLENSQDLYDLMRCGNCRRLANKFCPKCESMERIRENRESCRTSHDDENTEFDNIPVSQYMHLL